MKYAYLVHYRHEDTGEERFSLHRTMKSARKAARDNIEELEAYGTGLKWMCNHRRTCWFDEAREQKIEISHLAIEDED